ncbi:putative SOS response-associated peptidase YedK [Cupriavidus metallidurans]|jgi:putative SOS response-associated peptidase YedK|uniref:Abasic site processing protein n=1 Tax=Cupriavidus metallidurans (strain ATCC 43123 / DSM 2839 / NBRC 102507 / CH34) TaxID=266264 RepID=Q58AB2_CUPMC|nr:MULTISPECIES: SOS response-associated peptidase family protein [Cupriavidus]ABF12925.1 conserved hypothetical protein [Cupriavidus metallidurans CH34]MDE4922431.1 SOS response-associated peptidase family protein [Cupriavidus metallidurans]QGS31222.1 DUF159 family protein [Cupriavidus metallidurans]CAI11355.1 hypothetical protein [Cupriavidus metallidurans CH34]GMG94958.1 hypothetical protein Cmtc_61780 [Cupriavidus sp. TKC]
MCVNYAPVQRQVLRDVFGVEPPSDEWRAEAWRDYPAPIIRAGDHGQRECVLAGFGMVPKAEIKRRNEETMQRTGAPPKVRDYDTMNARLETIGKLQSFAKYWRECRLALVGATAVYEPCWETGKAVRWRIGLPDGEPFAIAGLWRDWPDGSATFTMPTVAAETHALMRRMHAPGKEKRSVVILPRDEWDDWLNCRDPELARSFLRLYPADAMVAEAAPAPPRKKAVEA